MATTAKKTVNGRNGRQRAAPAIVGTIDELASRLGRAPRGLYTLMNLGLRDACKTKNGYSVAKAEKWIAANVQPPQQANGDGETSGELHRLLLAEKLRKLKLDNEIAELRAAELRGELVAIAEVEEYLAENAVWLKARLEQCPDGAIMTIPQDLRASVREEVRRYMFDVLTELAGRQFEPEETGK